MNEIREINKVQIARVKTIRRLGEKWIFFLIIFMVFNFKKNFSDFQVNPNCPDLLYINKKLDRFIDFLQLGCFLYIIFAVISVCQFCIKRITEFHLQVLEYGIIFIYFGFMFLYSNILYFFILGKKVIYCNDGTPLYLSTTHDINIYFKFILTFFLIGWYTFIFVKILQQILLLFKRLIYGKDHTLEEVSILVDMEK